MKPKRKHAFCVPIAASVPQQTEHNRFDSLTGASCLRHCRSFGVSLPLCVPCESPGDLVQVYSILLLFRMAKEKSLLPHLYIQYKWVGPCIARPRLLLPLNSNFRWRFSFVCASAFVCVCLLSCLNGSEVGPRRIMQSCKRIQWPLDFEKMAALE